MFLPSLFTLLGTAQVLYAASLDSQIVLNAEPVTGCGILCAVSNQAFIETVPLRDEYSGTIEFQWVGEIGVGTPPQVVRVIFDTGSCRLLVPSVECTSESCDGKKKFDPNQSSTYESFHIVKNISFDITAGDVTPVQDGDYNVTVVEGMETVTIGQLRANNVSTELIIKQTPAFAKHTYDGILGFGPSSCKDSFMDSAIKQGVPAVFGFYLTPHAVGNAELTIGGIDHDKLQSPLVYVPVEPPDTFAALNFSLWVVNTTGISVNGKTSHTLNQTLSLIVDTGTSNMVFPEQIAKDIYSLISPEIRPLDEFGTWGIECDKLHLIHAQLEFSLVAENGDPLHLKVPNEELFVGKYGPDPKFCQTYINSFEGVSIIGGSVLKYYYTAWNMDVKNPRLGFALNKY